ncbi:MAG: HAMP domain-containing sensor histidine kinase [Nannocystaceae bacterium]
MSSRANIGRTEQGPVDLVPRTGELVHAGQLEPRLARFLDAGVAGVAVFETDGTRVASAAVATCPIRGWDRAPAGVLECLRGFKESFCFAGDVFSVRELVCGSDLIGVVVWSVAESRASSEALCDAMHGMLELVVSSGYARWMTSQVHEAASEGSYATMRQHNAELERAVAHLREVDELKSSFLATVSHELRTPLTSVIGFSDMLLKELAGPLNEDQREYVTTVLERGEELLELISSLLEMSRLEVGAMHLSLAKATAAGLVGKAIRTVGVLANRASVDMVADLGTNLPSVHVDPQKVHQVLVNLLSNAVKFTGEGGSVHVLAAAAPSRRPFAEETLFGGERADAVRITVRDDGIGIAQDRLKRIFEPFYQVDGSATRKHGGAGLGLAISKKIVEAHGGEIWAESTVGGGTSFHFTMPIAPRNP